MLWANGHITIDIVESAQRLGTRFKFIRQQKEWAFSYDMWGKKVSEYVEAMLGMQPENCLALCDESRQMAKNITKRSTKGQSMPETKAQLIKTTRCRTLLKEGHPATCAWVCCTW